MKVVRVAVAAILREGKVLIAKRPDDAHQGGLWEFPGGKIEPGETVKEALSRELQEEIAITPLALSPLIQITHHYPDKSVHLDVWKVTSFDGEAKGLEGQPIRWLPVDQLRYQDFPAANKAIIDGIKLPQAYAITGSWETNEVFENGIRTILEKPVAMIQLRLKGLDFSKVKELVGIAKSLCMSKNVLLVLNTDDKNVELANLVDGIHLSSKQLEVFDKAELAVGPNQWIGASCHNENDIDRAVSLGVNYISISPVAKTNSHPDQQPIGWDRFAQLAAYSTVPVFALGGMSLADTETTVKNGGQGIAAISEFWR